MWARVVECMLGCWLLMSPFNFGHPAEASAWWYNDLAVGSAIIILSLISYWGPTSGAHWLLIPIAIWLIGFGRLTSTPPLSAAEQNHIILGLLLAMFAIVPNHASQPPAGWQTAVRRLGPSPPQ